jgi:hypothetical protein
MGKELGVWGMRELTGLDIYPGKAWHGWIKWLAYDIPHNKIRF